MITFIDIIKNANEFDNTRFIFFSLFIVITVIFIIPAAAVKLIKERKQTSEDASDVCRQAKRDRGFNDVF